jgi:hypothetical protein
LTRARHRAAPTVPGEVAAHESAQRISTKSDAASCVLQL